jgi:uncharacterized protein HemX
MAKDATSSEGHCPIGEHSLVVSKLESANGVIKTLPSQFAAVYDRIQGVLKLILGILLVLALACGGYTWHVAETRVKVSDFDKHQVENAQLQALAQQTHDSVINIEAILRQVYPKIDIDTTQTARGEQPRAPGTPAP